MLLGVLWGVISTFFSSAGTIFWKKALGINTGISNFGFMFLGWSSGLLVILYFLLSGRTDLLNVDIIVPFLIFCISMVWIITGIIGQYVYKREKLSTIAPYENLNEILSIIISFFLFSNVSVISLGISLLIICLIFFVSVDIKHISFPKNIKIFACNQILVAGNIILVGYVLSRVSTFDYFIFENLLGIIVLLLLMFKKKDFQKLQGAPKVFYKNRFLGSFLGTISYLISLYIIYSFGIIINILLSFLYLFFILIFSYLFLGDKPEKKNIYLSIIVSILVGLGFYFK